MTGPRCNWLMSIVIAKARNSRFGILFKTTTPWLHVKKGSFPGQCLEDSTEASMPRVKANRCLLNELLAALLGAPQGRGDLLPTLKLAAAACKLTASTSGTGSAALHCRYAQAPYISVHMTVNHPHTLQLTTWCASSAAAAAAPAWPLLQTHCAPSWQMGRKRLQDLSARRASQQSR